MYDVLFRFCNMTCGEFRTRITAIGKSSGKESKGRFSVIVIDVEGKLEGNLSKGKNV